jgi:hypothetical protein
LTFDASSSPTILAPRASSRASARFKVKIPSRREFKSNRHRSRVRGAYERVRFARARRDV